MLENKITKGKIWVGKTWAFAINSIHNEHDGRIVSKTKYKNPNNLLCDDQIFDAYYLEADAGHRSYRTKVPTALNDYVTQIIKA
jgi:hypothetical protein